MLFPFSRLSFLVRKMGIIPATYLTRLLGGSNRVSVCQIQRPPKCQILPFLFCGPFQSGSNLYQLQTHQTQPSPSPSLQVPSCTFPSLRAKHSTVHPPWEVSILSCKQRLRAHTQAHGACHPSPRLRSGSSSRRRRAPRAALALPAAKTRGHPLLSRNNAVEPLDSERVRSYRLPGVYITRLSTLCGSTHVMSS